jgi:hypothetical protein
MISSRVLDHALEELDCKDAMSCDSSLQVYSQCKYSVNRFAKTFMPVSVFICFRIRIDQTHNRDSTKKNVANEPESPLNSYRN